MPTYQYKCSDCGHSFDFFQKFAEDPLTECPECKGPIHRVPQPVGIVFKGSGWYVTDSRNAKKSTEAPVSDSTHKNGTDKPAEKKEPAATTSATTVKES